MHTFSRWVNVKTISGARGGRGEGGFGWGVGLCRGEAVASEFPSDCDSSV